MTTFFVVECIQGKSWDPTRGMREQDQWLEHAAFMDILEAEGFIVLGGPLDSSLDNQHSALLIIDAPNEEIIKSRLSSDPWSQLGILETKYIKLWTILLDSQLNSK
ncbi:MAG: hypothetical protein ACFFD1_14855 [Candidatus Thorarchaeota archaeon]